jgi:hypothetical protein
MKTRNSTPLPSCVLFLIASVLINTGCKKEIISKPGEIASLTNPTIMARAIHTTTNEKIPVDIPVFIPCAVNGAGEFVILSGSLHVLNTFTINGNKISGKYHFQPQGIRGTGETTGDKYQATGVTQGVFKGSLVNGQFTQTDINNFRIIGQGRGNNFLIHATNHFTINANGTFTSVVNNFKSDCK